MDTVADDLGAAQEHPSDRAREFQPLVGREVARVMQVRLANDPVRRRVEQHEVGIPADLDRSLGGHPEEAGRRRREHIDEPFQGHPAAADTDAVGDREQRLDARRAIRDRRERLAQVPLLDGESVGDMVGRDEVEDPRRRARATARPGRYRRGGAGR